MKIRSSFVSNSSSSSYIISTKGMELAKFVQESYGKLFDLWMELNPDDIGYGLDREKYQVTSVDDIIEHFKKYGMDKNAIRYYKECLSKEAKKGYIFLLGETSSDDGTPEQTIIDMFNEDLLHALQGRYNWESGKCKNDIELIFNTRWS